MESITTEDLLLINSLSNRVYHGNQLLSNANQQERNQLISIKRKLRSISNFFETKYGNNFGPFTTGISSGNPIAIGGTRFNNVWSGLFKGANNKQYCAQISFVMNRNEPYLNVGFYFGAASAHSISADQRHLLENQLAALGNTLSHTLENNVDVRNRFEYLFDNGFQAIGNRTRMLPDQWIQHIINNTANSHIFVKIPPNELGYIDNSIIDSFVAQVMFLMKCVEPQIQIDINKPLTPEQRAKQAERRAIIGHKGEVYVMESEKLKLEELGIETNEYPKHVALESMNYGYDILSLDENEEELYIEVKTTTRTIEDPSARKIFISVNEVNTYRNNTNRYRIYRVYDIENDPNIEELNFDENRLSPDGFYFEY